LTEKKKTNGTCIGHEGNYLSEENIEEESQSDKKKKPSNHEEKKKEINRAGSQGLYFKW